MSVTSQVDLISALSAGDFQRIIGTAESKWVDFKAQPYDLKLDDEKLELAKDVTGMMNAGGGEIVLGFATRSEPNSKRDVACGFHAISEGLVDVQAYQQVIRDYSYPPVRQASIEFWESSMEPGKGAFTISCKADPVAFPTLVHSKRDKRLQRGHLIGVFSREDDDVEHYTVGEIHTDIKIGRLISRQGIQGLQMAGKSPTQANDVAKNRLEDDWRKSGLIGSRRYYLQAYPAEPATVQGLGRHSSSDVRRAFSDPPQVRFAGFSLGIKAEPEVLPDGGLRVTQSRESRSLERGGLLTWTCSADRDFLAHAEDQRKQKQSIHPLALVESTYLFFVLFLKHVMPALQPPVGTYILRGGMADLHEDQPPTSLCAGDLGAGAFHGSFKEWYPAPKSEFDFEFELLNREPGEAAFKTLSEVYERFGLDKSVIPYCERERVVPDKFPRQ
ncbi:MAG: hypothetical protein IT452_14375 [Planctomycetia bacterium]|nr:hypothetical protein [Planctomycetia bacterium]